MFSKLKIYLCIAFVLFAQTAQADKIKPLNDWARETQRWQNDATEVAYALTRCGILFSTIGIYFVANGTKAEDKANGEKFIDKGKFLNMTGIEMAVGNGMGIDAATARNKKLFEIYIEDVKSNKSINNNIFYGNTGKDFDFCLELDAKINLKK